MLINLRGIRNIEFNADKTKVTVQGGAIVSEVIKAAYDNETLVVTGNCDCIGILGSTLGGGYSRLMGLHGLAIDNILSLDVVSADGRFQTITAKDEDLWWAFRGAGHNFGIVTAVTLKAYPTPKARNGAWLGQLIFTPDKLEALVEAIDRLSLNGRMAIFLFFISLESPGQTHAIVAFPYYFGSERAGKAAFSSILAIGPFVNQTAWTPYDQVNAGSAPFCVQGNRKPAYGALFTKSDPAVLRAVYHEYLQFTQNPDTQNTTVLVERYSLSKAIALGAATSSFPFRSSSRYNTAIIPWYTDPALDPQAKAFGTSVRNLLWSLSGSDKKERQVF